MAIDNSQSQESDLDRTDRLPILQGVSIDEDVADDSVRLDYTMPTGAPGAQAAQPPVVHPHAPDFARPGVDLPSLADSVRSVEERIARQNADYEALNRLYEKAQDAQLAAGTRADALASELSAVQSTLAVEQHRFQEMQRMLSEGSAAVEASRARAEESARDAERYQSEARTLREASTAREATIAQALHSLGERDAQLFALQREHAQTVPVLEARSRVSAGLEADLQASRANAEALSAELKKSQDAVSSLTTKLARGESDLAADRRDLSSIRGQAASYLEILRTRDWRGGFNQNLFRELDDKADAVRSRHSALQAECERLGLSVSALNAKLADHEATISTLQTASAAETAALSNRSQELEEAQRARAELHSKIDGLETERQDLQRELVTRGDELAATRNASAGELQRVRDAQAAAEAGLDQRSQELEKLRADALTHEEEMTVLMAHLHEARRPTQSFQADIKRLNEELALKGLSIDQLSEENRTLRATLERTRGALEERELLIRRLERSANNNANVLGRLQTSIERLGSTTPAPPLAGEFFAELIRIEGNTRTAYLLGRRTRIGRATGCELQIDSQSVSRHHAMLLKGTREVIIEDLNSTNGVLVNGRKVIRHVLSDGDLLTIGETQFECRLKPNLRASETSNEPVSGMGASASAPASAAETGPGPVAEGEASAEPKAAVEATAAEISPGETPTQGSGNAGE